MSDQKQIRIVKSNGEHVFYSRDKLLSTLTRVTSDEVKSAEIADFVEKHLYDGIPTSKIYQLAYSHLKKSRSKRAAGRYKLKKAIFDLGPAGYAFEIFVGKLFESFGYKVKVGHIMQGKCIQHEVDVFARKDKVVTIVETKFRGDFKGRINVQVPLYIHSRFNDIRSKLNTDPIFHDYDVNGFVVTNARFTEDAIKYAECVGLDLISWDYPESGSLKYFIDRSGLHPLTSLHSLRVADKRTLLDHGLVLCEELADKQDLMRELGFDNQRIKKVLVEASLLIKS